MRRTIASLLVLSFVSAASGLMRQVHLETHVRAAALHAATGVFVSAAGERGHDERDCTICMVLHMPASAPSYTPLLVLLGLFVAFLTLLPTAMTAQRAWGSIDCRGPPAPSSFPFIR